ncbi:MAG: oligosaccharide flippase family protein [Acidimicrobiales bacterium]
MPIAAQKRGTVPDTPLSPAGGAAAPEVMGAARPGPHERRGPKAIDRDADQDAMAAGDAIRGLFGRDALYTLGFAGNGLVAVIATPLITRMLGVSGFGRVASALALTQVLICIEGLGLNLGIQRAYLEQGGRRPVRELITVATGSVVVQSAVLLFTSGLWGRVAGFGSETVTLELTLVWAGMSCLTMIGMATLRAQDNLGWFNCINLIQTAGCQVLGLFFMVEFGSKPYWYMAGLVAAQVLALGCCLLRFPPGRLGKADLRWVLPVLGFSLPLVPQQLSTFVMGTSDRLVIQKLIGAGPVGRYQVSYNLASLGVVLVALLSAAWVPRTLAMPPRLRAQVLIESRDRLSQLTAPVLLGLVVTVPAVLRIWVPAGFRPDGLVSVVILVGLATAPNASFAVYCQALIVEGRTMAIAVVTGMAAVGNLSLNLILVPRIGIAGAAASTLCAYLLLSLVAGALVNPTVPLFRGARHRLPMVVAATLAVASYWLGLHGAAYYLRWGLGVACFGWFARSLLTLLNPRPQ